MQFNDLCSLSNSLKSSQIVTVIAIIVIIAIIILALIIIALTV